MEDTVMILFKGDTPLSTHTFLKDDGSVFPLPIDPSRFAMYFINSVGQTIAGSGVWSNVDTIAGTADYQFGVDDLPIAETRQIFPVVQLINEERPFDPQYISIMDLHI
jgi:hypothetical protein